MMDPPEHTAMRRRVSRPMTPRAVATVEPAVRAFVDARLDEVADRGECDIVEALFKPLPSFVVAHYLGVPRGGPGPVRRVDGGHRGRGGHRRRRPAHPEAALDLFAYAGELIDRRRADPGDDLVSDLVAAGDGRRVRPSGSSASCSPW